MTDTHPTPSPTKRPTLYLVDAMNQLFRAYHSLPNFSNSKGTPTGAVYGFTGMLLKLLREHHPDHLGVVFDVSDKTFRRELYPAYKAHRPPPPEDLIPQFELVRDVVRALGLRVLERPGYEADDLIATLCERARDRYDVTIISTDKDLMQLVGPGCVMLDTMRDRLYDEAAVVAKMGVPPAQIVDLLALMGDTSDNIPGVPSIGPKTAAKLLTEFGSLEGIYEALDAGPSHPSLKGKRRERLLAHRDDALLSQRLATVVRDVPFDGPLEGLDIQDLAVREPDRGPLTALFRTLEFNTWLRAFHEDATPTAAASSDDPAEPPGEPAPEPPGPRTVETARDLEELTRALEALPTANPEQAQPRDGNSSRPLVGIDALRTSPHAVDGHLVGLALALPDGARWYAPLGHTQLDQTTEIRPPAIVEALRAFIEGRAPKVVHDRKALDHALAELGLEAGGVVMDTMLASYLVDADRYRGRHTLPHIALDLAGDKLDEPKDLLGSGRKAVPADSLPLDRARDYLTARAAAARAVAPTLEAQLQEAGVGALLHELELPLARVLAKMERHGVAVDKARLNALSRDLGERARALEAQCHELAGEPFNVGSPKQLGVILFERLGLPPTKRTKTGYSTDNSVLEQLAEQHPLPAAVIAWRSLTKLKNTYTDQLPRLICAQTGRIHTSFNQAVAATGRLSSADPNLQNIPVRTAEGRRIREAFVAPPGTALLSADYSQIELRVLAHLCQSAAMIDTFRAGEDVHRRTAAEIFGVPPEDVTRDQRAAAKTINFGVLYGISPWRLAREQGLPQGEAKAFIDRYFERYPDILRWKEETLDGARERGFVTTLLGRVRRVADIRARNHQRRAYAERIAINTPVQGSAADIIKVAMIRIDAGLAQAAPGAKMLLQVHDELVFEVPLDEVEAARAFVVAEMERAFELAVPLAVNAAAGANWLEAH